MPSHNKPASRRVGYTIISAKDGKNFKPNRDFSKQFAKRFRKTNKQSWMWDNTSGNHLVERDLFCFWSKKMGKVNVHKIRRIMDASQRNATDERWADNVGHGTRNVLKLSRCKATFTLDEVEALGVRLNAQSGTTRVGLSTTPAFLAAFDARAAFFKTPHNLATL